MTAAAMSASTAGSIAVQAELLKTPDLRRRERLDGHVGKVARAMAPERLLAGRRR